MHRVRYFLLYAVLAPVVAVAGPQVAPPPRPVLSGPEVEKMLARGKKFAEQGKIDLFVAATAEWKLKADDGRLWKPAVDLGRLLVARADMTDDRRPHECPSTYRDFATYVKRCRPTFTRLDAAYCRPDPDKAIPPVLYYKEAIQAFGVSGPSGITNSLIVSRGSVETNKGIHASVIFANGNVAAPGGLYSLVVVCDGDVVVTGSDVGQALIVARGNITVSGGATRAVLMAGGKVTLGKEYRVTRQSFNVIKQNETNPLGITFFELSTVGVEVKGADGAVRVASVAERKPFAAAGVKVGDVITGVNGKKPDSAESLRRLLRDALAVGDATVTLKRGDKTETVKVSLPE